MLTSLGNLSIERGDAAAAAHAPATVVRAHFERGLEQLSGAKGSYEAAFGREDHPKVITAVQGIAKAQAKLGNQDAAVRSFHKAMDLDPRRQASVRVLMDRVAAKKDVDAVEH